MTVLHLLKCLLTKNKFGGVDFLRKFTPLGPRGAIKIIPCLVVPSSPDLMSLWPRTPKVRAGYQEQKQNYHIF